MRVGLCGLGDRLSYVAKVMSDLIPGFEIISYADPTPSKLDYMLERKIEMRGYHCLESMLETETLDFLMIGSPNHLHLEQIKLGLKNGLKIFTEKPVVITESETFELLDLIKQYDAADDILVGMVLRYSPLYKDLIASKQNGDLGELVSIEASEHIAPEHGAFFMRDWRRNPAMSGGFMLEKCCHDIDLYQGVVGCRPKRIASFGGRKTFTADNSAQEHLSIYHERKSRWGGTNTVFNDGQLIDNQVAIIEYQDGTNLCFHTNLNVPDEYRHFCVVGTNGMAEGDFVRAHFKVHDAKTSALIKDITYQHDDTISMHYGAEEQMAADWIDHFENGTPLPVSIINALEAGLTAIKIDEARTQNSIIDLTELWERFDSYGLSV
ncbi:gfo/Idh/MocA family oxidoreductase [Parashewanella spongiae]|uniref:Gfo/Idh/MocA family oxidoreductase n=1 Tax=Parashewanella spongiae TaxID=342950 RepID=A0A3A6ULA5_9GAMM|nr:Gfo/Idh/MocA family oxidoreductase [Parashewanella spongiae]MCL1077937.1 Gfo/Idh/MocA family oxidoreductase [Parashewanella spongiae]RJY18443.1 gfo/Idh/MocA family oxidoreductase [Parashewanella spongiae]